jgi:Xaa-Pro aminopeptidase
MPRNGDQYYPFRQQSDFFYLTGIREPESIVLISPSGSWLFLRQPSEQKALWEGAQPTAEEAAAISGITQVGWLKDFNRILEKEAASVKKLYLNLPEKLAGGLIKSRDEAFLEQFRSTFPFHETQSLKPLMKRLRLSKEPEEIAAIQRAVDITGKALKQVLGLVQPGTPEKTIEAEITRELIINQAEGFAFDPIIASGKNATTLHYSQNNDTCRDGELLLMDFGAEYQCYAADITRTIPVSGHFSSRQKACYQAVLDVMDKTMKQIRPGMSLYELNHNVQEELTRKHIELGLYTENELRNADQPPWKKYFPHGVSHFMGLDVHDPGDKHTILEKGMVITWEPGLYIPEEGIGIRIEDDILVDDHPVNLSASIPKSPEEIETIMQKTDTP